MEREGKKGFFRGLKEGLKKTREGLVRRLDRLLMGKVRLEAQTLEQIEEVLISADIGVKTTERLIRDLEEHARRQDKDQPDILRGRLKEGITSILELREGPLKLTGERPFVVMAIGVNGVGKTTTIAKMARQWKNEGHKVLLVAGDTFRAAAIEQLEIWGESAGVDVVRQQKGADPSAVVYDALQAAKTRGTELVILDTAGRLHTKVNLMDELKKIQRVAGRVVPGAPHEVLLVLDATTGQNAISQAKMFHEAVGVTGIAMTKLDGTAKGGILVAIASELDIPIRYIGVGEKLDDLQEFHARDFVEALFGDAPEA
ncbi:MAG: signal recognition particle-docking protein FtsY [Thermodesulfobacteriota bacterium]